MVPASFFSGSDATFFLESFQDCVLVSDETGQIVWGNGAVCGQLGYPLEELVLLPLSAVQSPVPAEPPRTLINAFLRPRAGGRIAVELSLTPVVFRGVPYRITVARDMRERVRLDAAIYFAHDLYHSIFAALNDAVVVIDPQTNRIVEANTAAEKLLGFPLNELRTIERFSPERLGPGRTKEAALGLQNQALHGESVRFDWSVRDKQGRTVDLEISLRSAVLAGEQRLVSVVRDLTSQRRLEMDLARAEYQLGEIAGALTEGIVVHGSDGRIVYSNPAASAVLGLTADQLRGRTSFDPRWGAIRTTKEPWPGQDHPAMVSLRTGQVVRGEVMGIQDPATGLRWIRVNASPLFHDGSPVPTGVVATFVELSAP